MDPTLFPRGIAIGFAIAAPVGPIGVLVIRRTLLQGRLAGFVSGAGAATADAFYGALAALGLTFLSSLLVSQSGWIRVVGGIVLCYLGANTLWSQPEEGKANASSQGLGRAYASTVLLTITNPATILSFGAVFAGLGLMNAHAGYGSAALLVAGVFSGSLLWWFLLSGCLSLFRGPRVSNRQSNPLRAACRFGQPCRS